MPRSALVLILAAHVFCKVEHNSVGQGRRIKQVNQKINVPGLYFKQSASTGLHLAMMFGPSCSCLCTCGVLAMKSSCHLA